MLLTIVTTKYRVGEDMLEQRGFPLSFLGICRNAVAAMPVAATELDMSLALATSQNCCLSPDSNRRTAQHACVTALL
jgi:hypothetical protein